MNPVPCPEGKYLFTEDSHHNGLHKDFTIWGFKKVRGEKSIAFYL